MRRALRVRAVETGPGADAGLVAVGANDVTGVERAAVGVDGDGASLLDSLHYASASGSGRRVRGAVEQELVQDEAR